MERPTSSNYGLVPVRETFRALRYSFRQNGRLFRRVTERLRKKVAIADAAEERLEVFVKDFDTFASNLGRRLLKGSTPDILVKNSSLQTGDKEKLARIAYTALNSIVNYVGMRDAYVSEYAALKALLKLDEHKHLKQSETAAALMMLLLDEKVLRYPANANDSTPTKTISEAIPVFALLLWLQSEHDDPYAKEAFSAATDLSVALSADVLKFSSTRDMAQLSKLFDEFSSHV